MNKYCKTTPEGTRDLLFEECEAIHRVEQRLTGLFQKRGFHEVMTPALEYYDVFAKDASGMPQEMMYKLSDSRGRLMVLRPDCTLPIARLTSTRLRNGGLPLRLYYNQRVYRANQRLTGRSDEIAQAGVELIGASGVRADLEMIVTAVEALKACGAPDFILEIGHAGVFKAVSEQLPLDESGREDVRTFIESKNYGALNALLDKLPDNPATRAVRSLPRLFGGEEVFGQALNLCGELVKEPLEYLRTLYRDLSALGLGSRIMIDLGLVHRGDYYSGVIFRGYMKGYGDTVLSGGRYDSLLGGFGYPAAATGFGVHVESLARAMLSQGRVTPPSPAKVLIHGENGYEMKALQYLNELAAQGEPCEFSVFDTIEEALDYARRKRIPQVIAVGETTETIPAEEVAK